MSPDFPFFPFFQVEEDKSAPVRAQTAEQEQLQMAVRAANVVGTFINDRGCWIDRLIASLNDLSAC